MKGRAEFHIPSLDGIRGLAALIVFVSHSVLPRLIPGAFGVTVFFFLSGYLITTLLRSEYASTGKISLKSFYLRRVYRILPPMYIVLILAVVLGLAGVLQSEMTLRGVLAQAAHLTNYYWVLFGDADFAPGTSGMWSLAIEEHFYLLFPLALGLLYRRFSSAQVAGILLAVCGLVLAWRMYLVLVAGYGHGYVYFATDTRVDSLLYGCILGVWCNPALDRSERMPGKRAWFALLAVSLGLLLFSFVYRSADFREVFRYSVQGLALFVVFFCAVRFHDAPGFAWLESRPMRAMGLISYTFYLVHFPSLLFMKQHVALGIWPRAALAFLLTLAISTAMYFLVERHMAALRRRLHGRKQRESADSIPITVQPSPGA